MSDEENIGTREKAVRANLLLFVALGIPGAMITGWALSMGGAGIIKMLLGLVGTILLSIGLTGLIWSFELKRSNKGAD